MSQYTLQSYAPWPGVLNLNLVQTRCLRRSQGVSVCSSLYPLVNMMVNISNMTLRQSEAYPKSTGL